MEDLTNRGVSFKYEAVKIRYQKKPSNYTPDLLLPNGIIVEIKGYFDAEDRSKHLLIKEQHPELDIRFVFQQAGKKIHKLSKTTYADWAVAHGFTYAEKTVPEEWLAHTEDNKQIPADGPPRQRKTARKNSTKAAKT